MLESLDTLIAFVLIYLVASMLITIVVQIISTVCNFRGSNLAWGLAETFETIDPGLVTAAKNEAKELADNLLKDTMISDRQLWGWSWRATAVAPQDLFDLLHRIASGKKTNVTPTIKANVQKVLDGLGLNGVALAPTPPPQDPAAQARAEQVAAQVATNLVSKLSEASAALPAGPEKDAVIKAIQQATADATQLAQNATRQIVNAAQNTDAMLNKAYQKFATWFESGQERAQQWFVTHTKVVTWVAAFIFAFFLQLDAIEIYSQVSTNKTMRDKLVAQAGVVEAQATRIVADGQSTLSTALAAWKQELPDDLKDKVKDLETKTTDTRGTLRLRAGDMLPPEQREELLKKFDAKVDETAKAKLAAGTDDFKAVQKALDNTGFEIYPFSNDGNRWIGKEWSAHWLAHIGGMLFSAGLLSLGAPFWFNLLKSMMNLRSVVAENIEEKKKREGDGEPGAAPVTVKT